MGDGESKAAVEQRETAGGKRRWVAWPVSPLAKGAPDDPRQVERFEGFIAGMEVCNAFSELNDPLDQLQRFVDENYRARHGDEDAHPIDEDFIEALTYGMPPTGGFGMGIERLVTWICGLEHLRETIAFPRMLYRIYP